MTEQLREIKPEELISTLLQGAPTEPFDFVRVLPSGERTVTKIRVRLLRVEENIQAIKAAQDFAKATGELDGYGDIYKEAQAYELLQRAVCHPDKRNRPDGTSYYPPLFTDSRMVRASFTEAEIATLLNCYQITRSKHSVAEGLEEQDAEMWITRLSDPLKGAYFLSQLDSLHWPACISLLAGVSRDLYLEAGRTLPSLDGTLESSPKNSMQDTGSFGEQPSASSTGRTESVTVTPGELLTKDQARAMVKKTKKK